MSQIAQLGTDLLWGILEANRLTAVLFADTTVHFIAMAAAVMLWTRYVISYLDEQNLFSRFLRIAGILFMCFEAVVVAVNLFRPVLFWFDEEGAYHASGARYVTLIIQIILFFMTSVYTLTVTSKTQGTVKQRHMAIGFFGIAMVIFIAVQFFYPLLPFYAMGYMLGSCVLHSFVMEAEKEEYRKELEAAIERDTGIGMSIEFMEHMYDAFSQEDASTVNKYGSTGLGMSITRSLVELMNGHIDVQSEKGKGTTFTVTIPFEEAEGETEQEGTGQASMDKAAQEHAGETPGTAGEPADIAGLRVLVAEDIDVNYEIMTLLLSDKKVQAERAENGKIAVQKFRDHEPGYYDAIFMDMRMPEMDGLEATRIIRAMDRQDAVDIPIIALTANAFDDDVQRSMQAGLNAHLSKPIEPDVMYRTLKSLVRK